LAGWALLAIATVGVLIVALVPAPYVIEQPGPVYDTLGNVTIDGEEVPLIDIPSEKLYPTSGSLDMLTVSIRGNRENLPNWIEIASAYLDPSKAVIPVDSIYPEGVTQQQSSEQSAIDMENSQKEAVAAALTHLGYDLTSTLTVSQILPNAAADGILEAGDVIVSLNGNSFADVSGLRAEVAANGTSRPATVEVKRAGELLSFDIVPRLSDGADPVPVLGIGVASEFDVPFDVKIQLENVGGPSAGMMFALGIIDKLTPGELTGGERIAGTGTINASGDVGPIGGIRQKLYGASNAGANWFLAPKSNCDEVTGHIPDGLTVYAVGTLDDAVTTLETIADGGDTSALATCAAG
jgi:PDZ domain-containing protein